MDVVLFCNLAEDMSSRTVNSRNRTHIQDSFRRKQITPYRKEVDPITTLQTSKYPCNSCRLEMRLARRDLGRRWLLTWPTGCARPCLRSGCSYTSLSDKKKIKPSHHRYNHKYQYSIHITLSSHKVTLDIHN
jgi:hypothetical protein